MTQIEKPSATTIAEGFEKLTNFEQKHSATPDGASATVFHMANGYLHAGLSLVAIKTDGSKQPALTAWKQYETRQPTETEIRSWFAGAPRGIALVGGKVSGGLECVDIDAPELIEDYLTLIEEHSPGLIGRLVIVETPRGGRHLVYRCSEIAGNQKLSLREVELGDISDVEAKRQKACRRKLDGKWCKVYTLIETRGEGGYFLAPGSPASCHATGREYRLLQGSFASIPKITPTERAVLLDCARSLNEHVKDSQQKREPALDNGLKPGADFNLRGDVSALLERNGWRKSGGNGIGERWIRPGGDRPSATLFEGSRKFFVFSTNATPLEYDRAYSPFALLTALEHGDDFPAAAKALAAKEYGDQKQKKKAESVAAPANRIENWSVPQPIPDGLLPVPKLPESLIPEPFGGWILDIGERLQVPLDFLATPAIVAAASVIGNRVRIKPKRFDDWTVTPNLWGGIVGRPGVMKSPAIEATLAPLRRLIKDAEAAHAEVLKEWQFEKEAADIRKSATREKMKKAAKANNDLEVFRAQLSEDEPEEPHERRYLVNDSTVEKYGELLNRNPNGLLIFRDELTGWLRSLDDEQRAKDRAFYLEAWNGDGSFVYDRIGRGTLKINCTTTSIFGGIQPSKLETYLRAALEYGDDDDGLMQRLQMMVYPDIPKEWENIDRWPDTKMKNCAFEIFKSLRDLDPENIGAEKDDEGRWFLRFTDEAQQFFDEWFVELNLDLRNDEFEHPALESHFSKYKSLMPSLALVFHLIEAAAGTSEGFEGSARVCLRCVEMAAAWCSFLMAHAKRIYGLGISANAIHAKTLAKHLQAGDLEDGFTARDIYLLKGWSGLSSIKATEQALDLLENLGWVGSIQLNTGGRPKTVYCINPKMNEVKL